MIYNSFISKLRSLASVGFSIIASKLSLIILDVLIANIFGVSVLTDSLILCLSVTTGIVNFYLIQTNRNLVGIYSSASTENAIRGIKNFLNLNLVIFFPIVMFYFYNSENIIGLLFENAGKETIVLTSILVRYFLILLLINIIIYNISALGIINNKPRILANSNIINAITTSILLLAQFYNRSLVNQIGVAFVVGGLSQLIYVIFNSSFPIKELIKKPKLKFQKGIKIIAPIFFLLFFSESVKIYEKSISASLGEGVVSSLYYSNKLNLATLGILTSIYGYLYLPKLSRNYSTSPKKLNSYIKKTLLAVLIIACVLTIILNANSSLIIDLFFNYTNKIDDKSLIISAFKWYNYTSVFYMIVQIGSMIIIATNRHHLAYIPLTIVFIFKLSLLGFYNHSGFITPLKITQIHMISYTIGCFLTLILIFKQTRHISLIKTN